MEFGIGMFYGSHKEYSVTHQNRSLWNEMALLQLSFDAQQDLDTNTSLRLLSSIERASPVMDDL